MNIEDRKVAVRYRVIYDREGNKKFWKQWMERIRVLNKDGFLEDYLEYCKDYE